MRAADLCLVPAYRNGSGSLERYSREHHGLDEPLRLRLVPVVGEGQEPGL